MIAALPENTKRSVLSLRVLCGNLRNALLNPAPALVVVGFDIGLEDRTAQLSPFSLTGIALAGATLPADELGRREGILTAREIAQLDLSSCRLATQSACNCCRCAGFSRAMA